MGFGCNWQDYVVQDVRLKFDSEQNPYLGQTEQHAVPNSSFQNVHNFIRNLLPRGIPHSSVNHLCLGCDLAHRRRI